MSAKRHALITALVTSCCLSSTVGSEEDFASIQQISIVAQPREPFGQVTVNVTLTEGDEWGIAAMSVKEAETELSLPKEAFETIKNPLIQQLRVSSEAGFDKLPWLYVSVELHRPELPPGERVWVYFAFQEGQFVKRFLKHWKPGVGPNYTDEWRPDAAE